MDISIRGTKGLGTAAVKIVWRDAAMTVLRATEYLTEVADADTLESSYYAAGLTPPTNAVTFDVTVIAMGRVWASGAVADYASLLLATDARINNLDAGISTLLSTVALDATVAKATAITAMSAQVGSPMQATARPAGDYPTAITYSGTNISSVTWNSGKSWAYHYNGSNQLTSITES